MFRVGLVLRELFNRSLNSGAEEWISYIHHEQRSNHRGCEGEIRNAESRS
jgi:hypothetical protein